MPKHHTKNTVSVAKWCNKCRRMTQHAVSDHRETHCLDCLDRAAGKVETQRPMGTVFVQMPCECDRYPFAHFHVESKPLWTSYNERAGVDGEPAKTPAPG